jgi:hypothetical protein
MPRPPAAPAQDEATAVVFGGCRVALAIPPCPADTETRLSNTERSCVDDEGHQQGTTVQFAENSCITLSTPTATPAPFVAITQMGVFVDGKRDGVWHLWSARDGKVTLLETTPWRRGRRHGVQVRPLGDQEQLVRHYLGDG